MFSTVVIQTNNIFYLITKYMDANVYLHLRLQRSVSDTRR